MADYEIYNSALSYNKVTGSLTWKITQGKAIIGNIAGTKIKYGYIIISLNKRRVLAHRIAWLLVTGNWPKTDIDHKDGNPSNNAWDNLREATKSQNLQNQKLSKKNTSGFKGVTFHKKARKWMASIYDGYRHIYLGLYSSKELAHEAYCEKAKELFGLYWRAK